MLNLSEHFLYTLPQKKRNFLKVALLFEEIVDQWSWWIFISVMLQVTTWSWIIDPDPGSPAKMNLEKLCIFQGIVYMQLFIDHCWTYGQFQFLNGIFPVDSVLCFLLSKYNRCSVMHEMGVQTWFTHYTGEFSFYQIFKITSAWSCTFWQKLVIAKPCFCSYFFGKNSLCTFMYWTTIMVNRNCTFKYYKKACLKTTLF